MKNRKCRKHIISVLLALLTLCSCLSLQTYAQEDPQNVPQILWTHLYTRYDKIYLIGKTEETFSDQYDQSVDISCRISSEEKEPMHCVGSVADEHFFIIRLEPSELADVELNSIQSVTLSFQQDFFGEDSPEFTYSTDELATDEPILINGSPTFSCACEGMKISVKMLPDAFMFVPLQMDPQWFTKVSFDFGSKRLLPTRYAYDGETLVIERFGAISDYSQLEINEEEKIIYRSFKMLYKDAAMEGHLRITEPNDTLLLQQRRIMWLYLIIGGFFVKFIRRVLQLGILFPF